VEFINNAIDAADEASALFSCAHVQDPSDEIVEVLIQAMEWNILSRKWNLRISELAELQERSVSLLKILKSNLPNKTGEIKGWNFEKAHSILHKVREIVYWGWSENTSCQGPEHAHIDFMKSVGALTNNKTIFLCILRFHARTGCLQEYENLLQDLSDEQNKDVIEINRSDFDLDLDRNFNLACEAGVRYPTLQSMFNRHLITTRCSVRFSSVFPYCNMALNKYCAGCREASAWQRKSRYPSTQANASAHRSSRSESACICRILLSQVTPSTSVATNQASRMGCSKFEGGARFCRQGRRCLDRG
jgi:hypothetical protein